MREAPSLALITALQDMGARVRAFDPAGMSQAQAVLKNVTYCENAYDCAEAADALVIATEWEQFRALDLDRLRDLMACPVVVDLRNIYRAGGHEPARLCLCVRRKTADGARLYGRRITRLAGFARQSEGKRAELVGRRFRRD